MNEVATPLEQLRAAGLRATPARLATLTAVVDSPHISADAVAATVRAHLGTVSTQTIYDALRALTDAGLLRKFQPTGQPTLYELYDPDHHQHFACRICGTLVDVAFPVETAHCLLPLRSSGYVIDEAEIVYWGACPDCVATREDAESLTTV